MPRVLPVLTALIGCAGAMAQPVAPLTNNIQPTVTAAIGDVGGKFFGAAPDPAKTRRYYVAAEPQLWDYAPQGQDPICGKPLPPPVQAQRKGGKVRYVQYTDETFTAKVIENPSLGILGPVLRGVVGDFISVTFLNRASRPLSMHPHGVKYDKDSEGSLYQPKPGLGAAVDVGAKFTYVWQLDEDSGPRADEPSSKGWLYHSHVEGDEEAGLGLVGFIVVTDPKRARPDGTPSDVDRELASLFMIFDESGLGAEEKEAAEYANLPTPFPRKTWTQVQELTEQGERNAINGYIFGNAPGLEMNEGERVRWYLFGLGSENDFHTAHWHGVRVLEEGRRRTDVIELLPASMKVADVTADNPGTWLFHCHVARHMQEGMFARMVVHPKKSANGAPGPAFFGLPQSRESLRIGRAEATLPSAAGHATLRIEGTVSVPQAFSVFISPVAIRVGNKSFNFKMDRRGNAATAEGKFTARNSSQYGVVYGGLMQFEANLSAPELAGELKKLGTDSRNGHASLPITVQIGRAQHSANARLAVASGEKSPE
jgi:manganese oxidase